MKRNFAMAMMTLALCAPICAQEMEADSILRSIEDRIYDGDLERRESKRMFGQVKELSEEGNTGAACLLGILYKDGIGTRLDFDRAREQFETAYEMGSGRAAYSLGYLYLKGLGNIDQDYQRAMEWFKKSDDPMAQHWLAKMYWFGYGVHRDGQRALELLKDNPIYNSEVLLEQFDVEAIPDIPTQQTNNLSGEVENIAGNSSHGSGVTASTPPSNIEGAWKGYLMEMDWSGKTMSRSFPVGLSVGQVEDAYGSVGTSVEINGTADESEAIWKDGTLTLFDSQIGLEKQYTDHPDFKTLDYDLLSISFVEKNIDGTVYLIGRLESRIIQWSEPGPPMTLVLTKEDVQLSDEVLAAFAQQEESFIKLYPNPFVDNLLIYYELGSDSNVEVRLLDYYGGTSVETVISSYLKSGEHTHTLSNSNLRGGLYVVQVRVNGQVHSKLVIKK
nr:T9SS type A sorting domain-containing protein [Allomuricauda sp.]